MGSAGRARNLSDPPPSVVGFFMPGGCIAMTTIDEAMRDAANLAAAQCPHCGAQDSINVDVVQSWTGQAAICIANCTACNQSALDLVARGHGD